MPTGPYDVLASVEIEGATARRDNVEELHRRLRGLILAGEIPPGTVMSRVAIARKLGVSRTPLREAVRLLQSEGWVEAGVNQRVKVAPVSATDLEELTAIRVVLETEATSLSVASLTIDEIAALEGRLAEMAHFAGEESYEGWQEAHRAFHRGLTAPAGQRFNTRLAQLSDHTERYRRIHIARSPAAWQTATHREILDAAKTGDRHRTARLMADHLTSNALEVMELLEPGYDAARLRDVLDDVHARHGR
jgi:GntR family transcriptional regulator, rspAB operon transcriptional repressor